MKLNDVLFNYVNNKEGHPREIGRYWASEVYAIKKGYKKPEDFFKKKIVEDDGMRRIVSGLGYEKLLSDMLDFSKIDYIYNPKTEYKINDDITLVVKPDFVFPEHIWEMKTTSNRTDSIPDKWAFQLECEAQVYQKPVYLVVASFPFQIKFFEFKPSTVRWKNVQKTLIEFDSKLKQINENKDKNK